MSSPNTSITRHSTRRVTRRVVSAFTRAVLAVLVAALVAPGRVSGGGLPTTGTDATTLMLAIGLLTLGAGSIVALITRDRKDPHTTAGH